MVLEAGRERGWLVEVEAGDRGRAYQVSSEGSLPMSRRPEVCR